MDFLKVLSVFIIASKGYFKLSFGHALMHQLKKLLIDCRLICIDSIGFVADLEAIQVPYGTQSDISILVFNEAVPLMLLGFLIKLQSKLLKSLLTSRHRTTPSKAENLFQMTLFKIVG